MTRLSAVTDDSGYSKLDDTRPLTASDPKQAVIDFADEYIKNYPAERYAAITPGFPKGLRSMIVGFHNLFSSTEDRKWHSHKRTSDAVLLKESLNRLQSTESDFAQKTIKILATYLLYRVTKDTGVRTNQMGTLFNCVEGELRKLEGGLTGTYAQAIERDNDRIAAGIVYGINKSYKDCFIEELCTLAGVDPKDARTYARYERMSQAVSNISSVEPPAPPVHQVS